MSSREQIFLRAQELGSQAVLVDVLPLVQLSDPGSFDYGLFWRPLLGECRWEWPALLDPV
jgi:hypothetical protein